MANLKHGQRRHHTDIPALEWVAAGVGLLIVLGLLGFIGWQAWRLWRVPGTEPPAITVRVERIVPTSGGHVVEIVVANASPTAAAAVQVEGKLRRGDADVATSVVTLDYVPGGSERRAGLLFGPDPRPYRLEVRALGYADP